MIFWLLVFFLTLSFGLVVFFGPPYLPSFRHLLDDVILLSELKSGMSIIDLGCGDGKVLRYMAKKGIYSIGYEINPILFVVSWLSTIRYRKFVKVIYGNFWHKQISDCDVVYVFLLPRLMTKLDSKLLLEKTRPFKLISYSFEIPQKKYLKKYNNLFLYQY